MKNGNLIKKEIFNFNILISYIRENNESEFKKLKNSNKTEFSRSILEESDFTNLIHSKNEFIKKELSEFINSFSVTTIHRIWGDYDNDNLLGMEYVDALAVIEEATLMILYQLNSDNFQKFLSNIEKLPEEEKNSKYELISKITDAFRGALFIPDVGYNFDNLISMVEILSSETFLTFIENRSNALGEILIDHIFHGIIDTGAAIQPKLDNNEEYNGDNFLNTFVPIITNDVYLEKFSHNFREIGMFLMDSIKDFGNTDFDEFFNLEKILTEEKYLDLIVTTYKNLGYKDFPAFDNLSKNPVEDKNSENSSVNSNLDDDHELNIDFLESYTPYGSVNSNSDDGYEKKLDFLKSCGIDSSKKDAEEKIKEERAKLEEARNSEEKVEDTEDPAEEKVTVCSGRMASYVISIEVIKKLIYGIEEYDYERFEISRNAAQERRIQKTLEIKRHISEELE